MIMISITLSTCQKAIIALFLSHSHHTRTFQSHSLHLRTCSNSHLPTPDSLRMSQPAYKLTYFDLRWAGESIRFLLSYVGQPFEDKRIPWVDFDHWRNGEERKKYRYAILPFMEEKQADGSVVTFQQSFSIMRYLGNKYGLVASTPLEKFACDEYADCIRDLVEQAENIFAAEDDATKIKLKEKLLTIYIPRYFNHFSDQLTKNKHNKMANGFVPIVGKTVTWADFILAHWSEMLEDIVKDTPGGDMKKLLLEDYPVIKQHQQGVFGLKGVKEWIVKRPVTQY